MSNNRWTHILLLVVAILLLANLARPILAPGTAFAQKEAPAPQPMALSASGNYAWVLKGNQIFYIKFEANFESIRIYGPEDLE